MVEKKSNNKIKILIILVILLILGGAGFGVYKIWFDKPAEVVEEEKTETKKKNWLEGFKEDGESSATPLLYEVSKEGSDTKLYLFGSIHVADDRAYPMNPKIMDAYNKSDYLAVEFDIIKFENSLVQQTKSLKYLMYEDGDTVKNHLKPETYELMVNYLVQNDSYDSLYDSYKPATFDSLVSSVYVDKSGLDSEKGIDNYFLRRAKADKKNILEVESSEFQYKLLNSFPDELMDFMIRMEIEYEDKMIEEVKESYESWLVGDDEKLIEDEYDDIDDPEWIDEYPNIEELLEDYDKELVYKRNDTMTKVADTYFKDGKNAFIVVGAAHIVGDTGMAKQLQDMGYNVNIVNLK